MSDFFFVVKCLVATLVLLVVMQMRIGHRTIEQHSLRWIQTSNAVEELRNVAEGAVRSGRAGYERASEYFGENDGYSRRRSYEEREARRSAASTSASSED